MQRTWNYLKDEPRQTALIFVVYFAVAFVIVALADLVLDATSSVLSELTWIFWLSMLATLSDAWTHSKKKAKAPND